MAGYVVLALALVLAGVALRWGRGLARAAALATGAIAFVQAGLGVATVMTGAHLTLSLLHQAGAIALWIAATLLWRAMSWR
jgi:cytochrome c oxidase assembly protein subunit 15